MRHLLALTLTAAIAAASTAATAQDAPKQQCAIGYVTGVGGAEASFREYLATPDRDRYRYVTDHPIQCQVSDDDRATGCTGLTYLSKEKVSVYDDVDSTTMSVVAKVELDHGRTYPVIILVRKQDVRCDE